MGNKRGSILAGELLAQLAADPEYQAMRRVKDQDLARIAEQRTREQQALLQDLAAIGIAVDWIGQLLEMPIPDAGIYPVLLDHLTRPYSPWLSEWIGRAFGRKAARPTVWSPLVDLLKSHTLGAPANEGVMAALSQMAQPGDLDTLINLLSDTSLGFARLYLVRNLMRSKRPEARTALLRHQIDPDLSNEITARLSRSRG